jgi:hypothetical protein
MIKCLKIDNWVRNISTDIVVSNPTFADIEKGLESLDGTVKTMLFVSDDNDSMMIVGGDPQNLIIQAMISGQSSNVLIFAPKKKKTKVKLNIGAQVGEYSNQNLVTYNDAIKVLKYFCETGKLSPQYEWVEDC